MDEQVLRRLRALNLEREAVEALGGSIWVEANQLKGTTITLNKYDFL